MGWETDLIGPITETGPTWMKSNQLSDSLLQPALELFPSISDLPPTSSFGADN